MKKTTDTTADKQKRKLRPVYFTETRWKALLETGNASHALNKLCDGAGIPEQPITDKNTGQ